MGGLSRHLYLRIWLAVVLGVAVLMALVGWACWRRDHWGQGLWIAALKKVLGVFTDPQAELRPLSDEAAWR